MENRESVAFPTMGATKPATQPLDFTFLNV